ncbi:MAG: hypothetical protein J6T26_08420 [Firmicutes bacterium]|nr:hypothetical protein [Bacillota bacterium]
MKVTEILDRIKECDKKYLQLFCSLGREWGLYVYQDRSLPELPAHNYLLIPDHIPAGRLRGLADVARNTANATGRSFLRIRMSYPLSFNNAVSESWGHYYLNDADAISASSSSDLSFCVVDSAEKNRALAAFETAVAEDESFGKRRAERFGQVYLSDNGLSCWLCCRGDEIVARGELFVSGDTAKIVNIETTQAEDTVIIALLRHLIEQGRKLGAELFYTESQSDLDGFTKISEYYTVQWQF